MARSRRFADGMERFLGARLRLWLSGLNARIPISVTELFLLLLPLLSLLLFLLAIRAAGSSSGMRRALSLLLSLVLVFFGVYVVAFSPGNHKTALATSLALDVAPPTAEELYACALWLSGLTAEAPAPLEGEALTEAIGDAYAKAGARYGFHPNTAVCPKETVTPLFRRLELLGLYAFPFGEVTLAGECHGATRAFTLAHEMAHASGYTAEAEADIVAFLACLDSGEPYLRYAGATGMLGRVLTVLSVTSPGVWEGVSGSLPEAVRREFSESDRFSDAGATVSLGVEEPCYDETVLLLCGVFRRRAL